MKKICYIYFAMMMESFVISSCTLRFGGVTVSENTDSLEMNDEEKAASMATIRDASVEEFNTDSIEMVEDDDVISAPDDVYTSFGTNGTMVLKRYGMEMTGSSVNTYYAEYGNEDNVMLRFNCYPHSKFGKKDFAELTHCYNLQGNIGDYSIMIPSRVDLDGKEYIVERVTIINHEKSPDSTAGRIVFPPTIERIKVWGWTKLKEVVLNEGFEELNERAFRGCHDLESVILPHTLKRIGKLAFENCSGITKIHIPASVNDVCGGAAFVGLNKGVTIEVEEGCDALKGLEPINGDIKGSYGYDHYKFNPDDLNIVYVK